MVVFSNRRLGPSAEVLVSPGVAREMLQATAAAALPQAAARWEHELVRWLVDRAGACSEDGVRTRAAARAIDGRDLLPAVSAAEWRRGVVDVADIAWTPEHFDTQRAFLLAAIALARAAEPAHDAAMRRWSQLVATHPRDSVSVGRRWQWARADSANA